VSEFSRFIDAAQYGEVEELGRLLQSHPALVHQKDAQGATALHHAAFGGHSAAVKLLVEHGADINARDDRFGATPAGWAIEYMREMGALLGIEISDCAHAIQRGDVDWVKRFLTRLPALRHARDGSGKPLKVLAQESGNAEIAKLFESGGA
jgi:ankyrin repeat protein